MEILEPRHVAICVPYFGPRDEEHRACIEAAKQLGLQHIKLDNHPYIDQARCLLAERALAVPEVRVVTFVDHDIIFDSQELLQMAREALAQDAVIAGLYLTRRMAGTAVATLDPVPEIIKCFKEGGLYPASQLPGGFTAIPRAVLERVPVPTALLGNGTTRVRRWFENNPYEFERRDGGGTECLWTGEDSRFSHRARDAGVKLFVDTRPRLWHKGSHKFGLEDGHRFERVAGDTLHIHVNQVSKQVALK